MSFFWPEIQDSNDAQKACGQGAGVAFFVAVVTGTIAWLQASGKINILPGLGMEAFIDVALFVVIGLGLIFKSRIAGVGGVLLYFGERIFMFKTYGVQPAQLVPTIIFGLAFIAGMRGSFAWHEFKNAEAAPREEGAPKSSGKIFLLIILLAAAAGGGYFFLMKNPQVQSKLPDFKGAVNSVKIKNPIPAAIQEKMPALIPDAPGVRTFRLYNGKIVKGKVLEDDSVYYRLDTGGGAEQVLIKEDITEEIKSTPAPQNQTK